jgi:DNA-binding protein YbaB
MEKEANLENEKMAKAKQEIEEILVKYGVILVPVVMHQGDKTISRIDIAPASKRNELQ